MSLFSFPTEVNEHAARLVATGVVAISLVALGTSQPVLVALLAIGFILRVGWGPRFSPLARLAMGLAPRLWTPHPVFGAPKRFAQGVGAVVTVTASALLFAGFSVAGWSLVGVLVLFATLEASLAFCMGCWVYGRLQILGLIAPDTCVDCGPSRPGTV